MSLTLASLEKIFGLEIYIDYLDIIHIRFFLSFLTLPSLKMKGCVLLFKPLDNSPIKVSPNGASDFE